MFTRFQQMRRNSRQARIHLEILDDRLVLSAAAAGTVTDAVSSRAALLEQRHVAQVAKHDAKLARMDARHEARLEKMEARKEAKEIKAGSMSPVTIASNSSAAAPTSPTANANVTATATVPALAIVAAPSTTAASASSTASPSSSATNMSSPAPVTSAVNASTSAATTGTSTTSSTTSSTSTATSLPPNVAAALNSLYQEYESSGGSLPSGYSNSLLEISGDSVGVNLQMNPAIGDFSSFLSQLESDGLTVTSSSATYGLVDGMLPIGDLPAVAQLAASVTPMAPPTFKATSISR